MARGRIVDILADKIIISDEETGSLPFFLIDDDYGISGNMYDYALVVKKKANRAATKDDCENYEGMYIQYTSWTPVGYYGTLDGIFTCYIKTVALSKSKKLKRTKDYQKLIEIYQNIYDKINVSLQHENLPSEVIKTCKLADTIAKMEEQISNMKERYNYLLREADKLEAMIKEKRSMIIKNMEPKKHRVKLEKD